MGSSGSLGLSGRGKRKERPELTDGEDAPPAKKANGQVHAPVEQTKGAWLARGAAMDVDISNAPPTAPSRLQPPRLPAPFIPPSPSALSPQKELPTSSPAQPPPSPTMPSSPAGFPDEPPFPLHRLQPPLSSTPPPPPTGLQSRLPHFARRHIAEPPLGSFAHASSHSPMTPPHRGIGMQVEEVLLGQGKTRNKTPPLLNSPPGQSLPSNAAASSQRGDESRQQRKLSTAVTQHYDSDDGNDDADLPAIAPNPSRHSTYAGRSGKKNNPYGSKK